jgi:hypothetical protein
LSDPTSGKQRQCGDREKGRTNVPEGDQDELELTWISDVVAGAEPYEVHRHICDDEKEAGDQTPVPEPRQCIPHLLVSSIGLP